jgi:hypothetical protein
VFGKTAPLNVIKRWTSITMMDLKIT